ncbi:MoaD/ThiS family protein [Paraconexibacter sp.]|uniref:MoaD/ThiS family protein n=1 Tax=Paraconexibacter sp. TaxID=2949640 RepID=UPI003563241E
MPTVRLRGALRSRAGDLAHHEVAGRTVADLLRRLEDDRDALSGWILDERGHIRRHITVFVNGERGTEDTALAEDDTVDVLPAISGGTR